MPWLVLAVNENVATQPYEVGQRIFEDRVNVEYRLEEGAARAVDDTDSTGSPGRFPHRPNQEGSN